MTRPMIRILLPPRPSPDSYSDDSLSPQSTRPSSKRSSTSGANSPRSSTRSPAMTIRTRPSYKEDKHWQDTPPSSPRYSAPYPDYAASPSIYSYRPSWYPRDHASPRPSSALAVQPPPPVPSLDYRPPHHITQSPPPPPPPPPPRSSISSASSSTHSRRSSNSSSTTSDYLYGEDFAYGTGPLYVNSYEKTEAALAAARAEIAWHKRQGRSRRKVRFV